MTREEAINELQNNKQDYTYIMTDDAIDMAIKALEQEPCDDAISRKAVLDALNKWDWQELYLPVHFKDIIDDLPSIQPTAKENLEVEDCISREEVCDYIAEFVNHEYATGRERELVKHIIGGIQHLPSIQPKPKTDTWSIKEVADALEKHGLMMSEISEIEIKSMTKEQNYMRGYEDGKSDVLDKIRAEIEQLTITKGGDDYVRQMAELFSLKIKVLQIIDKYKAEKE